MRQSICIILFIFCLLLLCGLATTGTYLLLQSHADFQLIIPLLFAFCVLLTFAAYALSIGVFLED